MPAELKDLLTEKELNKFTRIGIDINRDVRYLTWLELSNCAYDLMITEGIDKTDGGGLASYAINILTLRAMKKGLSIFE